MLDRLGAFFDVEMGREINLAGRKLLEQAVDVAVDLGGDAVDLDAVAGGEQHYLIQVATDPEPAAAGSAAAEGCTASFSRTSTGAVL